MVRPSTASRLIKLMRRTCHRTIHGPWRSLAFLIVSALRMPLLNLPPGDGCWHADFSHATFSNRCRRSVAFFLQSADRTRSRRSDWPRRSLEFGADRTSAAGGSECGHPHVWRSSTARRSLLCDLLRKFALDQATLRTSAMRRECDVLQGRQLPPPGICFDWRPLSARENLLRPRRKLTCAEVSSRSISEQSIKPQGRAVRTR
jgi:hypothetical protein